MSMVCPRSVQGLFQEIPEAAFRADVSSTELRQKAKGLH